MHAGSLELSLEIDKVRNIMHVFPCAVLYDTSIVQFQVLLQREEKLSSFTVFLLVTV